MFDPERVVAISQGLSAATPPVTWSNMVLDPEGVAACPPHPGCPPTCLHQPTNLRTKLRTKLREVAIFKTLTFLENLPKMLKLRATLH